MILFLGDSFTWGSGLYYKKWIQDGKSIDYCNNHLPNLFSHENISYSDDEYRRKHHFPNLVSKYYNKSYYVNPKNGGTNKDIYETLNVFFKHHNSYVPQLVVIQFTEFFREFGFSIPSEYAHEDISKWIELQCTTQIDKVYSLLVENQINNILFFSWREDIGKILQSNYHKHYLPIYYKHQEYNNFEDLLSKNDELKLGGELGIDDSHFSELGHQVIADSIIKKVDTMNINFNRPK